MREFGGYVPPEASPERPKAPEDIFMEMLPDRTIAPVDLRDIPPDALRALEKRSKYLVRADAYAPGNFEKLFVVTDADGNTAYVARQRKTYGAEGDTEELTYIADLDAEGAYVGFGELRFALTNADPYFKDKPFVGYTETEASRRGKGFGMRRLRTMNALARMTYGHPLHSDTLMSASAKRTWETLAESGEAVRYMEGDKERYAFTAKENDKEA